MDLVRNDSPAEAAVCANGFGPLARPGGSAPRQHLTAGNRPVSRPGAFHRPGVATTSFAAISAHDIRAVGTRSTRLCPAADPPGPCNILVSADPSARMCTYLGPSVAGAPRLDLGTFAQAQRFVLRLSSWTAKRRQARLPCRGRGDARKWCQVARPLGMLFASSAPPQTF